MAVGVNGIPTQADMDALAAAANSKLDIIEPAGGPFSFAGNNWLQELNRLRYSVFIRLNPLNYSMHEMMVSGPWPLARLGNNFAYELLDGYGNIFNTDVFANFVEFYYGDNGTPQNVRLLCRGPYSTEARDSQLPNQTNPFFQIRVGGNHQARLRGRFAVYAAKLALNPTALCTGPSAFNGFWTLADGLPGNTGHTIVFYRDIDMVIDPGAYGLVVDFTNCVHQFGIMIGVEHGDAGVPIQAPGRSSLTLEATIGTSSPANGIHSTLPVRKIVTDSEGGGEFPFGLYGVITPAEVVDGIYYPDVWTRPGVGYYASTDGLWLGKTFPTPNISTNAASRMPWNPIDGFGAPTGQPINETPPARQFSVPRYPYKRFGETNSDFIPETAFYRWGNFDPVDWWIYKVWIHKKPDVDGDFEVESNPLFPIGVELGCVRNGSFVAFGTYLTGTVVDAMWPIFSKAPLVYRTASGEHVDVQAEVIWNPPYPGAIINSQATPVTHPIAAAYYNDAEAVIARL